MAKTLGDRIKSAWNAFRNNETDKSKRKYSNYGYYGGILDRPQRTRLSPGHERSIINAILNRISVDVASSSIKHVLLDQNGRYQETINDELNECLTVAANIDQTGRSFIQDLTMTMLDEGYAAALLIDADLDPEDSDSYKVYSMRVGKIKEWKPYSIRAEAYNELHGKREELNADKETTAIVENPFFSVMNEPNSTLQRLIHKLNLLDSIDEHAASGKLDIIIQLPYLINSPMKRQQAENRRKNMEAQLKNSAYGIAYADGAERIVQLNRPAENNLQQQIEYLTKTLYAQLGITQGILDQTASEQEMENYYNRTIEPITSALTDEFYRKFLTKNARTRGHSIMFFRDPFKLMPASKIAETADKLTRNEILSSNEVRGLIGFKPSKDPAADELRNSNISQSANVKSASVNEDNNRDNLDSEETPKQ